jgi:hypothetical protein
MALEYNCHTSTEYSTFHSLLLSMLPCQVYGMENVRKLGLEAENEEPFFKDHWEIWFITPAAII